MTGEDLDSTASVMVSSPRAAIAEGEEPVRRAVEVSAPRRSKRESSIRPDSAKSAISGQEECGSNGTPVQQQQRRSQRSGKSTTVGVTEATTPQATVSNKTGKHSLVEPTAAAADATTPPRTTRSTRGATAGESTTTPQPKLLHVDTTATTSATVADAVDADDTVASITDTSAAPRNRRPSRRQLEIEPTIAVSSSTPGGSRVTTTTAATSTNVLLSKYSASDATALCEVIWYQIKENAHKPDVLLHDRSPARIDWQRVAVRLDRSHEVLMAPNECQRLWKYITYGVDPWVSSAAATGGQNEEVTDSEPEEYDLPPQEINRRMEQATETTSRHHEPVVGGSEPDDCRGVVLEVLERVLQTVASADSGDGVSPQGRPSAGSSTRGSKQTQTIRMAGVQLYPAYDQPSGVPDGWIKAPFELTNTMPLVFVAEKFLKRKATAMDASATTTSTATTTAAAATTTTSTGEEGAVALHVALTTEMVPVKPKRKRKSDIITAIGEDGGEPLASTTTKPKKPRKKKEPTASKATGTASTATAVVLTTTTSATSTPTTKSPLGPRQSFVPSTTPPPLPTAARSPLQIFQRLYNENPQIIGADHIAQSFVAAASAASSGGGDGASRDSQVAALFATVDTSVRATCEQLALDDQRRFEREQLRRRLWEKATASTSSSSQSPAPSPGPRAAASSTSGSGTTSQIAVAPSTT